MVHIAHVTDIDRASNEAACLSSAPRHGRRGRPEAFPIE